jgi:hypothetical protein
MGRPGGVDILLPGGGGGSSVDSVEADLNGYLGWTFDPIATSGSATNALVSGTIYVAKLAWKKTAAISNIDIAVSANGATPTAGQCLASVIRADGTQIGITGDIGTLLTSGSAGRVQALPLSAPTAAEPGGLGIYLWAAILFVGTTGPQIARAASQVGPTVNANVSGASTRAGTNGTGQTALPSPMTMSAISGSNNFFFWAALR